MRGRAQSIPLTNDSLNVAWRFRQIAQFASQRIDMDTHSISERVGPHKCRKNSNRR
jgi:hypothetical protein